MIHNYPFPKRHILDASKLKEFADDDFQYDEKWWKFLLFPQCFQKTCMADM